MEKAIIIGAGPCGLATAAALQDKGIEPLVIEKGCIVQSIYEYPTFMQFHSTPDLLEIGGVPFVTPNDKPSRREGLEYYATVVRRRGIRVRTYEEVKQVIRREDQTFEVHTEDRHGIAARYETANVVVATGYFDWPNYLGVPGEDLPKVAHTFREAHPYVGRKVAIIGGRNSAVDAALELYRAGVDVTVVYRGEELTESVKSWVKPVFLSRAEKGKINMLWKTELLEITPATIIVSRNGTREEIPNDDVLVLTGFRPDRSFLRNMGVQTDPETGQPAYNPETMETNVHGIYIAGVVAAGSRANVIYIENGRFHGQQVADAIAAKSSEQTV
ncbi:YpdA family putative bacillithiol disulfide reductase [Xylanibacillus composti]|uniref:YpdA family putative bacillithiol disulfide reductase n=1 Tax=Xylanibacillus composti TaxID=1572762 RepID=A0A8J4H2H7_9BACL|nr:YpdA family putative bacillithiol disulfide reductase [Xylanibacillus composti]MDT9724236.1 YpdA family putative bacillithiol disulfide reductase [Xylanibacillus composti]GIQ68246.1 YpdA family putative bacillithiol disulfide reductase [Xylanibacillus composti]